jgi:hypothetical protein
MRSKIGLVVMALSTVGAAEACSSSIDGSGGTEPQPDAGTDASATVLERNVIDCEVTKNEALPCTDRTPDRLLYRATIADGGAIEVDGGGIEDAGASASGACDPSRRFEVRCEGRISVVAGPRGGGSILASRLDARGLRTYDAVAGTVGETAGFLGRLSDANHLTSHPDGGAWLIGNAGVEPGFKQGAPPSAGARPAHAAYWSAPETAPIRLDESATRPGEVRGAAFTRDGTLVVTMSESLDGQNNDLVALLRLPDGKLERYALHEEDHVTVAPFGPFVVREASIGAEKGLEVGALGQPLVKVVAAGAYDATAFFMPRPGVPPTYYVPYRRPSTAPFAIFFAREDGSYAKVLLHKEPRSRGSACTFEFENNCAGSCTEEHDAMNEKSFQLVQDLTGAVSAAFLVERRIYETTAKKATASDPFSPDCWLFGDCEGGSYCKVSRFVKSRSDERIIIAEIDPKLPGLRERLRLRTHRSLDASTSSSLGVSIRDGIVHATLATPAGATQLLVTPLDP